jgi:hypothetical protein
MPASALEATPYIDRRPIDDVDRHFRREASMATFCWNLSIGQYFTDNTDHTR